MSEMITVGQLRRAMRGLPDDAAVCLAYSLDDLVADDGGLIVNLTGFRQQDGRLFVEAHVENLDDVDPDEFDEEGSGDDIYDDGD